MVLETDMRVMRMFILCILFVPASSLALADVPTPAKLQLPFKPAGGETVDYTQRRGAPIRIRAKRQIEVLAGKEHRSKNNIVAIYIGLPVIDAGQDNVVIENVQSNKANPANIIFSVHGDSLLVEYFNVEPGFRDVISLTFTADIYERRASLGGVKPYDNQSPLYKKYTQDRAYAGVTPLNGEPNPVLQKHLDEAGVNRNSDPIVKARKIYEYLGRELSYGGFSDSESKTDDCIQNGKAHCGEYAISFVRLCREAGVPARRCAGFAFSEDPKKKNEIIVSGHNWAEFYVEGIGWIPVDPTMGDKKDSRKQYYFGAMDNARLCVSKSGCHDILPLWYKASAQEEPIFTQDASNFKPFGYPETIQGVHRFQYRFDMPIQISVPGPYGPSMTITSIKGEIRKPKY
jgi:transglutaminase-like putative cysteine protease